MRSSLLMLLLCFSFWVGAHTPTIDFFSKAEDPDTYAFSLDRLSMVTQEGQGLLVDTRPAILPLETDSRNFDFILLLFVFALLVFLIAREPHYLKLMVQSVTNYRLSIQFSREQSNHRTPLSLLYIGVFNVMLAMMIFEYIPENHFFLAAKQKEVVIVVLFICLCLLYFGKFILYRFFGRLFRLRDTVTYYLSQVFLINRVLGVLLVLFLPFVFFSPDILSSSVGGVLLFLLAFGLVWRYFFAIRHITQALSAYVFHFILYFCAVEIIPTAVIVKFLLNV
jgi:hypothetical protein